MNDDHDVMIDEPSFESNEAAVVNKHSIELLIELDFHLMENNKKSCNKNNLVTGFDILLWWRINSVNYLILVSLVRNIFIILCLLLHLSTRGHTLNKYRSYLTPDLVKVLKLSQNWLWSSLFVDTTTNLINYWRKRVYGSTYRRYVL